MKSHVKISSLLSALALGALVALAACAKKDSGNNGQIATTPGCQTTCNPGIINYGYGNLPPPAAYTYGVNNGFCGCTYGTRPIYNAQLGYACAPVDYLTYSSYYGYTTNTILNGQNLAPLNMQQINYTPLPYGNSNNCFTEIAASCNVTQPDSCGAGGYCRPIGGGSNVGVCTNGTGVDTYNTGYNNGYNGYYNGYNNGYYNNYYNNTVYPNGSPNGTNGNCTYRSTSWGGYVYVCGNTYNTNTGSGLPR